MAELVHLTLALLVRLWLGGQTHDHDHMGGGGPHQLVQVRLGQLVQLQLDVQAHLE